MAFKLHVVNGGYMPPMEYLPAGAITPKVGLALVQKNGNLVIAGATEAPTYISMTDRQAPCTEGEEIPVIRVQENIIFETTNQAEFSGVKLGEKVTLHTDGLQVTATKASGVAEVVYIGGSATGSVIRVRFA